MHNASLHRGKAENTDANRKIATQEIACITEPTAKIESVVVNERFEIYRDEYVRLYLVKKARSDDKDFQWPLTYLNGRASRKLGKTSEQDYIKARWGGSKNNYLYLVQQEDRRKADEGRIPDYLTDPKLMMGIVGEVKNKEQVSFDEQSQDFYTIAKGKRPRGELVIIRKVTLPAALGGAVLEALRNLRLELIIRQDVEPSKNLKRYYDAIWDDIPAE